ncbi:phage related protein (plasmid) [Selenomonas ruminantium subsp. lactilytica TAM6421]|uniref:Phage related protein n=1 Tax=Selenomonas ruminantium subsp. lactilytica (strain NBRC 103574 / TAM6421) TaxID=927704 RepID=I0GWS3_SELRL|nr:DUF2634 domain-containing protein [Selenomonas ruminantium]BAL85210.1 phage related protein [Selenomonas ruminantium subsp. lactilytica TAM6421]
MSNPFVAGIQPAKIDSTQDNLPLLQEFAWDMEHDTFCYDSRGRHYIVTENEALKIWIYKCLKTERYRYEAYRHGIYDADGDYGIELEEYIGTHPNNEKTAAEICQIIRESLAINPYIVKINSIDITERKGDKLALLINLTSIYGELIQEVKI